MAVNLQGKKVLCHWPLVLLLQKGVEIRHSLKDFVPGIKRLCLLLKKFQMLFTNGCNKLEALPLAYLSRLGLSLWVWLGANPRVDYSLPRTHQTRLQGLVRKTL
jgi:hypothetical protein